MTDNFIRFNLRYASNWSNFYIYNMSLISSATLSCCTGEESGNQRITNPKLTENKALNKYLNFLMTKLTVFLIYMTQNLVIIMWNMVWNEKICLCIHISISVNIYSYFICVYIILLSLHFFLCKNFHIFKHTHTYTHTQTSFSLTIFPLWNIS